MTAVALLAELRARGVEVIADGQRLGVRPRGVLTAEEREALRRLKAEVLQLLAATGSLAMDVGLRVAAFRVQLVRWRAAGRPGWPLFVLPDAPEPGRGVLACISCSAAIRKPVPGEVITRVRCTECVEAVRLAIEGELNT